MHLKTNIEHSPVQIIVLAICPLMLALTNVNDAVFFVSGTIACLFVCQFLLMIFNKYLNNDVKTILTALVTTMIVTVATIFLKDNKQIVLPENTYLIIFSTTILNAEFIYFNNKALKKYYFFNVLKIVCIFALMTLVFSIIKEFFAFGSVCEKQLFKFDGFKFCETIIFDLLWLASLCAISDYTVRYIDKKIETKNMVYQKYVRIIRSEKVFQYDKLRRERLLANDIEVNRINKTDAEKIKKKQSENEAIESIKEVVSEEEEVVDISVSEESSEPVLGGEEVVEKKSKAKKKKKKGDTK